MTADRFQRAAELFIHARKLPLHERDEWLDVQCEGDQGLRAEVERLLGSDNSPVPFATLAEDLRPLHDELAARGASALGRREAEDPAPTPDTEPASRIGPYRLLQKIGEGGFGVVYMAEQERPVRRRVALKIIKLGMDSRQVVARFEAERQALALMDHPNIARVYDAGTTETGRPYFVMELVKGLPITEYCDRERVGMEERLRLFAAVCHAVQHAHQKGIIHRDLKPTNVLVTMQDGAATPKIIDFGIAKAMDQRLTERTLFTEFRQMLGTPDYMSPEQADGMSLDVDTRTDIYSLGVLLYELLTGTRPFDATALRSAAYGEIQRIIREVDPPKPSTRFSSMMAEGRSRTASRTPARPRPPAGEQPSELAQKRATDAASLVKHLRGELDWIVMKAIEKDRTRRYQTASDLAADVDRFLNDEPVVAGPPTATYRLRKFAERNRGALAGLGAVILALLAGAAALTYGLVQADRQRDAALKESARADEAKQEAERQAALARANEMQAKQAQREAEQAAEQVRRQYSRANYIVSFLQEMLTGIRPSVALGRDTAIVRQMFDDATDRLERGELAEIPEAESSLRWTIGYGYSLIGDNLKAEHHLAKSVEIGEALYGVEEPEILAAKRDLLNVRAALGREAEVFDDMRTVFETLRRVEGPNADRTLIAMNDLGHAALSLYRLEESAAILEEAHRRRLEHFGPDHSETIKAAANLGATYREQGRLEEALDLHQQVYEVRLRLLGERHPETVSALHHLGVDLDRLNRQAESLPIHEKELALSRELKGATHPETLGALNNLASCYSDLGRYEDAERMFLELIDASIVALGNADHVHVLIPRQNLASLYFAQQKYAEALAQQDIILEGFGRAPPALPFLEPGIRISRARSLRVLGRVQEAEREIAAQYPRLVEVLGETHEVTAAAAQTMAEILEDQGRNEEAATWRERASLPPGG